ncbi:MAG: undecaprenyldiphospho-muramoylpentapeptide beta-N-acetylglucosaminyltransferase [Crocinitomicaceae bacterium]|jgi:UDP-N-acetylglucosamine--N-acetylmuramyl-(pentapeptide) pyrophosphoryl-undecaprenol N-acetylglucosamine transferase|nr:undecaprenyldiphospho-muramoylpentapeptide beta-N-acetylglucosaminyltransferase [Crocinitomicaceae bacterium]
MKVNRAIISGGGTGGHIFPAIAIANEIKRRNPDAEILFVGALGKMEMEKVPQAGYKIIGLPIAGFQRRFTLSNFMLPYKIIQSLSLAGKVIRDFKPDVVIGVGGYASGPTLRSAISKRIPTLIQEQNSFPGKTNKILAPKVNRICTAYEGLEKFFPKDKIVVTGNPVRSEMVDLEGKRGEAMSFFNLDPNKKTALIVGGSLGARTLNESVTGQLELIRNSGFQVLWQCGKFYYPELKFNDALNQTLNVHLHEFIQRMDLAYAVADVIISRAGAIAVSELCLVKKPAILVPSPNVAEDHQTKNAMALVNKKAAILVKDADARKELIPVAAELLNNAEQQHELSQNIQPLGRSHATEDIVNEIEKIIK